KPAATRARAARAPATQAEPTPEPADEDAPAEPADEDSPADEDNDWDLSPLPRTSTLPRAAGRRSARSPLRASRYSLRSLALTRRPLHPVSPHPPGGTPWQVRSNARLTPARRATPASSDPCIAASRRSRSRSGRTTRSPAAGRSTTSGPL